MVTDNDYGILLCNSYTTISSFNKIVQETNDLANQRELISENLQGSVLDPLKQLMKDKTIERKKVMIFWPMRHSKDLIQLVP